MDDETVFEGESTASIADVASLFYQLGDSLRDTATLRFERDDQTTSIAVPDELSVSLEVEREEDADGDATTEVEIELEWPEGTEPRTENQTEGEAASAEEVDRGPSVTPVGESMTPSEAPRTSLGRFEVYRDRAEEWRWRLVHRNGNIIATSGEGYTSRQNAEKGLRSVMANAPDANVVTEE